MKDFENAFPFFVCVFLKAKKTPDKETWLWDKVIHGLQTCSQKGHAVGRWSLTLWSDKKKDLRLLLSHKDFNRGELCACGLGHQFHTNWNIGNQSTFSELWVMLTFLWKWHNLASLESDGCGFRNSWALTCIQRALHRMPTMLWVVVARRLLPQSCIIPVCQVCRW